LIDTKKIELTIKREMVRRIAQAMENFNNNDKLTKKCERKEKRLKPKTKETRSKTQKEIEITERST
jgi:hypothetical protein